MADTRLDRNGMVTVFPGDTVQRTYIAANGQAVVLSYPGKDIHDVQIKEVQFPGDSVPTIYVELNRNND